MNDLTVVKYLFIKPNSSETASAATADDKGDDDLSVADVVV